LRMVDKWERQHNWGLLKTVFVHWHHKYTAWVAANRRRMVQVERHLRKAVESHERSVLHLILVHWGKCAAWHLRGKQAEAEAQRLKDLMSGKIGEANEESAMRQTALQQRHDAAKKSVDCILRKWEGGNANGLKSAAFTDWHKYTMKHCGYRRQHAAVEAAMHKFVEGGKKGCGHMAFMYWHKYTAKICSTRKDRASTRTAVLKFLEGDVSGLAHGVFLQWQAHVNYAKLHGWHNTKRDHFKEEMDAFISNEKARHKAELDREKNRHKAELRRNHASFEHALLAWAEGETKATRQQYFESWRNFAKYSADLARKRQSVHDAMLNFVQGSERAAVQLTFINWHAETTQAKMIKEGDLAVKEEAAKYQIFVNEFKDNQGQELDRHLSAAQTREEKLNEVSQMMQRRRELGEKKGMQSTIIYEWRRFVTIQKGLERRHESAKLACMSWIEGGKKGSMHLCFAHWVKDWHQAQNAEKSRRQLAKQQSLQQWRTYATKMHVARQKAAYLHRRVLMTEDHMLEMHVHVAMQQWSSCARNANTMKWKAKHIDQRFQATQVHMLKEGALVALQQWSSYTNSMRTIRLKARHLHQMARSVGNYELVHHTHIILQQWQHHAVSQKTRKMKATNLEERLVLADNCKSRVRRVMFLMCAYDEKALIKEATAIWIDHVKEIKHANELREQQETKDKELRRTILDIKNRRVKAVDLGTYCLTSIYSAPNIAICQEVLFAWNQYLTARKSEEVVHSRDVDYAMKVDGIRARRLIAAEKGHVSLTSFFNAHAGSICQDICTVWKEYVSELKSDALLRSTVKVLKARHLKGVHIEVESSVKEKTRLEGIGMLRAWLHYVAEEREGKGKGSPFESLPPQRRDARDADHQSAAQGGPGLRGLLAPGLLRPLGQGG